MRSVLIRGLACPTNMVAAMNAHRFECVLPGAFSFANLVKLQPVALQLYSHQQDAPVLATTADGTLRLFEDRVGLTFEADLGLGHPHCGAAIEAIRTRYNFASVNMVRCVKRTKLVDGRLTDIIAAIGIDHIAICDDAAVYQSTAVWFDSAEPSWSHRRLHAAASAWGQGLRTDLQALTSTRHRAAPDQACMGPRRHELQSRLAAERPSLESWLVARAFRTGESVIVGHAALSRSPLATREGN